MREPTNISKLEILSLVILYLGMLYLWTLPFQHQRIPYGEPDAAIRFRLADEMYVTDKPYIKVPDANPVLGFNQTVGGKDTTPPQFHGGLAISEIIGGDRVVPLYLYLATVCSLIFFSIYFLLRKLYGPATAILASFFIIFSVRERLTYLWGQWSTGIALLFVPIILYTYYKYTDSFLEKKEKLIYLYLVFILFAIQFLIHAAIFFLCVAMAASYAALLLIKERKIPFNFKHFFIGICLFLLIICAFAPTQTPLLAQRVLRSLGFSQYEKVSFAEIRLKQNYNVSPFLRLFKWYNVPQETAGSYPDFIFSFKDIYYGYWLLPFLIVGIAFLLLRRKRKDLLMLSMLIGLYLLVHADVIGMYLDPKVIRLFYAESVIFYPLIAIGIVSIPSFIKMDEKSRETIKYILVILAAILILSIGAKPTYDTFKNAYSGIQRLNSAQFEAANWVNDNLPEDARVMYVGTPTFPQRAWLQSVSARLGIFDQFNVIPINDLNINRTNYILMDYSWYQMLGDQQSIAQLQQWEKANVKGDIIYDKNGVEIYKVA